METLPFQRFRARLEYLQQHLQVVDLAITKLATSTRQHHQNGGTILDALGVRNARYDRLRHPVTHDARVFNFSRSQNVSHAIISLYRFFAEYLHGVLSEIYAINPLVAAGKAPGSLQYAEIVKLGNFEAISEKIVANVFRKLENERSTLQLLEKILDHTGVNPDPEQKEEALMYLEMRHLFVHSHGLIDESFSARFGHRMSARVGNKLPTKFRIAQAALRAIDTLLRDIDTQLIATNFARPR